MIPGSNGGDHVKHLGNEVQDPWSRCKPSTFIGPGWSFSSYEEEGFDNDAPDDADADDDCADADADCAYDAEDDDDLDASVSQLLCQVDWTARTLITFLISSFFSSDIIKLVFQYHPSFSYHLSWLLISLFLSFNIILLGF